MTSVPGGIVAETQSTSAEKRSSSQQLGTNWEYFGNPDSIRLHEFTAHGQAFKCRTAIHLLASFPDTKE